jgi:NTE family protein
MKISIRKQTMILSIVALFAINSASAQRPKVGLVLSGGGAKGVSHIGILQAIDSAGLKIDYITGTSMGSIMGSLYAIGNSGKEIEEISNNLDWDAMLSNKPLYSDISIDEKDEFDQYAAEIGLKKFKPVLGSGLIESEELWLKLNELFLPVYNVKDFSKFNIPFKCIATDLASGKAVVMDKGEIITAVRSSMAIPTVFSAVDYQGTKLVDGGIIRNFPVTDIKAMGADIVIGVNLFKGLPDISKLNDVMDVFYQITQYRDAEDLVKQKKLCDLLIEPPVDNYSAGSFDAVDTIMLIGKAMGKLYYPYFKHLADSLNALYPIDYNPNARKIKTESIVIDAIKFEGIEKTSKDLLEDKLQIKPGKSYNAKEINDGFRKAFSSRYYDKIYYHLEPTTDGHANLTCILKETLLTQAKVAYSYHSYTGSALFANITVRNLLLDKSRTMVKVAAGEYYKVWLQHRQAFGRKGSTYATVNFLSQNLPLFQYNGSEKTSQYKMNTMQFDFNLMQVYGKDWSTTAGITKQYINFSPEVVSSEKFEGDMNNYYSYLRADGNTTNDFYFPTTGYNFTSELGITFDRNAELTGYKTDGTVIDTSEMVDGKPEFFRFNLNFIKYNPFATKSTFFYKVNLAMNFKPQEILFDKYYMGGIQQIFAKQQSFVGLHDAQINTNAMVGAMIGVQYNFYGDLFLLARVNSAFYVPKVAEVSSATDKLDDMKLINGFSLGLGYDLGVLPMEFNAMYSPEIDAFYTHVKIGFIF